MQPIEIIVIIAAIAIVLGVVISTIVRKAKCKKAGIPYTCACCSQAKIDKKTGKMQCGSGSCSCGGCGDNNANADSSQHMCSGHCASCPSCMSKMHQDSESQSNESTQDNAKQD